MHCGHLAEYADQGQVLRGQTTKTIQCSSNDCDHSLPMQLCMTKTGFVTSDPERLKQQNSPTVQLPLLNCLQSFMSIHLNATMQCNKRPVCLQATCRPLPSLAAAVECWFNSGQFTSCVFCADGAWMDLLEQSLWTNQLVVFFRSQGFYSYFSGVYLVSQFSITFPETISNKKSPTCSHSIFNSFPNGCMHGNSNTESHKFTIWTGTENCKCIENSRDFFNCIFTHTFCWNHRFRES